MFKFKSIFFTLQWYLVCKRKRNILYIRES